MSKTNKTSSMFKLALPVCLLSAGALSAVLFPPAGASADSAGAEVNTTVGEFIRLAVDTNELILRDSNNNATIAPSASGTLITGDLNVAVSTNTTQGFSISVFTQDNTTSMTHESPSIAATIDSVAGATGYDASTGISDLANNTWGFRKQTGESGGNPTYGNWFGVGADETHGTVIENSNSSSSEYCAALAYPLNSSGCASGTYAEHTLNFGAKLIPSLPGGTYANNVVISAVAKSEGQRYTVDFDSNGGNNTMGPRTIIAGSTFTLPSTSNVIKEGYGIAGYAFTSDAASATYTPGQTVTVADFLAAATSAGQTPDSGITLYLIWEEPLVAMQDFDCSTLESQKIATLVDNRDNHEYKVKKLPDGKCWMIQNLTLSADDMVTEGKALTSANTNIPSSDTNSYYITPKNARYTSTGSFNNSAVASASASVDFSTSYPNYIQIGYRDAGDTNNNNSVAQPEDTAYYNFYTATLGYSYYNDGKTSGSSAMDICPKGWRLPKISDNGTSITAASSEFANLARAYNGSASWTNANTAYKYYTTDSTIRQNMIKGDASSLDPELDTNGSAGFTYAGGYNSTTLYSVGTGGGYLSSSVYDSIYGYLLGFDTSDVRPQRYSSKNVGSAVRCVAGS